MSANIDTTDGVASFASARLDPWHRLGKVLPDAMTAAEALEHSRLAGWNLRKVDLLASDDETGDLLDVADRFAIVRDNPVRKGSSDVLGVVGSAYTIMPNEALTGLLDALVDESGALYETAGAIDGGRKVFVSMKLPDTIQVGGVDPVDVYLAAMTSHDGSMPTTLMTTPVRIVCQNTLNLAIRGAANTFRIRHTAAADSVMTGQVREALDVSFRYVESFTELAERLINTEMDNGTFREMIQDNFGSEPDAHPSAETRAENRLQGMRRLFEESSTHEAVRGTAWAGYNALTEWFDHFSPVRTGSADDQADARADARARKSLLDTKFKSRALDMVEATSLV